MPTSLLLYLPVEFLFKPVYVD